VRPLELVLNLFLLLSLLPVAAATQVLSPLLALCRMPPVKGRSKLPYGGWGVTNRRGPSGHTDTAVKVWGFVALWAPIAAKQPWARAWRPWAPRFSQPRPTRSPISLTELRRP
jgi:hypothetical protein